MNEPKPTPNLLVVDDAPANLQLLVAMLKQSGFKVRPAPSGALALEAARREPPDLILLDIHMPEMNGYEVCERLKAEAGLKGIPVIFISALDGTIDKTRAFGVGGVDYVTKPFQFEEVEARVRAHLTLRRQERELQDHLVQLQQLEQLRDSLVHMVVHDMRTPLASLSLSLSMLREDPTLDPAVQAEIIQNSERAAVVLSAMTTQLLDISRMEAGQMPIKKEERDLVATVRMSLASLAVLANGRRTALAVPAFCIALFDQDIVGRVVANLLANAFKFTPQDGTVTVSLTPTDGFARVAITDTGSGIAPEYHQKIFEKFAQVDMRNKRIGTGLGLAFCKLAVETHGGQMGVESQLGHGSTFWFTLPLPSSP